MKRYALLALAAALTLTATEAHAQSLVATYYRCSTADEGEADFIMNTVFADHYQSQVDSGNITNWGWVEHQAGGAWRRISTITAPDRAAAMEAWGAIVNELQDEHPNAVHRFNEICDSHDDYVWSVVTSGADTDPTMTPSSWVSTYWTCNEQTEARADEIMEEVGQAIDRHVSAGHLGGWAWYAHDLGGRVRRLLTLLAADDFDVLEGREMVINELQSQHGELMAEFGSICNGHVDYMWANGRDTDG